MSTENIPAVAAVVRIVSGPHVAKVHVHARAAQLEVQSVLVASVLAEAKHPAGWQRLGHRGHRIVHDAADFLVLAPLFLSIQRN